MNMANDLSERFRICCQAWKTILSETEERASLLQENADKSYKTTHSRLLDLIQQKKFAWKTFTEERQRLETDFRKVTYGIK